MKQKQAKIFLIINTIIFGLWLPFAFVFLPFIAFAYDDPAAGGLLLTLITILWFIYPFLLLISLIGSWIAYKKQKLNKTKWFLLLPWMHIALFIFLGLFFFEA